MFITWDLMVIRQQRMMVLNNHQADLYACPEEVLVIVSVCFSDTRNFVLSASLVTPIPTIPPPTTPQTQWGTADAEIKDPSFENQNC